MWLLLFDLASELEEIKALKDAPEQWHWLQQQCPAKYVPRHRKCLWKCKSTGNQVEKCCMSANCNQSNSDPNSKAITRWHFVHRAHTRNLCRSRTVMVGAHEDRRWEKCDTSVLSILPSKVKQTGKKDNVNTWASRVTIGTTDLWKTVVFAAWILTLPCSRTKRVPTVLPCWTTVSPAKSKRRSLENDSCDHKNCYDIQSQLGNLFNFLNPLPWVWHSMAGHIIYEAQIAAVKEIQPVKRAELKEERCENPVWPTKGDVIGLELPV